MGDSCGWLNQNPPEQKIVNTAFLFWDITQNADVLSGVLNGSMHKVVLAHHAGVRPWSGARLHSMSSWCSEGLGLVVFCEGLVCVPVVEYHDFVQGCMFFVTFMLKLCFPSSLNSTACGGVWLPWYKDGDKPKELISTDSTDLSNGTLENK